MKLTRIFPPEIALLSNTSVYSICMFVSPKEDKEEKRHAILKLSLSLPLTPPLLTWIFFTAAFNKYLPTYIPT